MKDDKSNPYAYAIVFHFLLGLLNLGLAQWYESRFPSISEDFAVLVLASALWAACSVFLFKACQLLEISEITIVSGLRVVVTIVASVVYLQERLNAEKILGAVIILAATLLVVVLKKEVKLNRGLVYTLAMALFAGLAIVADSVNVQHYDVMVYNTLQNFLTGFMILAFAPKALSHWGNFIEPKFLARMLALAVFSTAQGVLYLKALTYGGHTAQIGTVRQASVIVTVLLAVVFLSERSNLGRKLVAAILVTLGVILLS